ncbi:four helix bundle protein [Gracilimonas sp.]|uniref:four helix bundle protein n=1 Tax=Gracilimonas sp. TaxID=1974203 RepID=UPI0032EF8DB1
MRFKEWEQKVPNEIRSDVVWKIEAYRLGLFLSDICWEDSNKIITEKRFALADQLYRSVGSISANITEGYSRFSNKEKARFCEIALGSTREARDWYFKSRHIVGEEISQTRIDMLTSIAKLLQSMICNNRTLH